MTDVWALVDIEAEALDTSVGLLDALMDAGTAGSSGRDTAYHAAALRRLGDNVARAAHDLSGILADHEQRTGRRIIVAA